MSDLPKEVMDILDAAKALVICDAHYEEDLVQLMSGGSGASALQTRLKLLSDDLPNKALRLRTAIEAYYGTEIYDEA